MLPAMKRWLGGFLFGALVLGVVMDLAAGSRRPQAAFRIHVQRVETGGSTSQLFQVALTNPDQVISVGRYADISENNIQSLMPMPDGGLMVAFDSPGTKLLESVTSTNMGRILVVFLNGRVVYAPEIDIPLRSGRFLVPGPLDPADRDALLLLVQSRTKKGS